MYVFSIDIAELCKIDRIAVSIPAKYLLWSLIYSGIQGYSMFVFQFWLFALFIEAADCELLCISVSESSVKL